MKAQVKQCGNSAIVCIPKPFLEEAGLEVDSHIEIRIMDGRLVIYPVKASEYILDTLLAGITAENLHGEVDLVSP